MNCKTKLKNIREPTTLNQLKKSTLLKTQASPAIDAGTIKNPVAYANTDKL